MPTVYALDNTSIDTLAQTNWPCTSKWDWADPTLGGGSVSGENYNGNDQIYLRLGETYLFLAEAYFRLGDNTNAAKYINVLRTRAHAPKITAGDITQDFILDERSRELFSEEHRRYTLLRMRDTQNPLLPAWYTRTLKYNHVAGTPVPWAANQTPHITLRDTLLPVPQDVIDANLTLKMPQNPGF